MPDIAAARDIAILLVVIGNLDPVQNPLCGGDLVRAHDHQHIL